MHENSGIMRWRAERLPETAWAIRSKTKIQSPDFRVSLNTMLQWIFICPRTLLPCPNTGLFLVLTNCYWMSLCICCTCVACRRVSCSTCNAFMNDKKFVLSCNVLVLEIWHLSVLWIAVYNQLSHLLPWRTKYRQQTLQSHLSPSFPLSFMKYWMARSLGCKTWS